MPQFSQNNAKNDGISKVQFHNTNLALKMPNWATSMPKWATQMPYWATKMLILAICCSIFIAQIVAL